MRNVKKLTMSKEESHNPLEYYNRIAKYIESTYKINFKTAIQSIKDSMYYGYAICEDNGKCIGIETNFDRSSIYVGEMR